jgi:hypothetical protein
VDTIRRVHAYTEEDGRQALVVRGRGLRLVAIPGESLADPLLRLEVFALLERLEHQGVPIDSGAKQLVEGRRPDDA